MKKFIFKNLKNLTVVEAKVSDHHPIIMKDLCSFNVLCRCEIKTHYTNNGFSINERNEEYHDRLMNKLIVVIQELIEDHGVKIFAFQEAPPLISNNYDEKEQAIFDIAHIFYKQLKLLFPEYVINPNYYKSMWGGKDACGLLMIHHNSYKIENELTQNIRSQISKKNQSRFQAFILHNKNVSLKLINLHADFHNQQGTIEDIHNLSKNGFTMAADFNLRVFPQIENYCEKIQQTEPGLMPYDTFDGILFPIKSSSKKN